MPDDEPTRIEIPGLSQRRAATPKNMDGRAREQGDEVKPKLSQTAVMEDRLRATLEPRAPVMRQYDPSGVVTAAEERVKMYEEMRRKKATQRMVRNLVESAILLMLLGSLVGLCLWWKDHQNKVAAEAARIRAEEEAAKIRLEEERDRIEREKREKDRLEREAAQAERERVRKAEQAERERIEQETRDNKERYNLFTSALRENKFMLFGKSVTNDMDSVGYELCYLLPAGSSPAPLYWVVHETNSAVRVYRMYENGTKDEVEYGVFEGLLGNVDYLVAKGDTVYFRSVRKPASTGLLSKAQDGDPAEAFFGGLAPLLKEMNPAYDELTFDIFFTPRGSTKRIFVENLEFGCEYSLRRVREAIEKDDPFNPYDSVGGGGFGSKKFKRTVKIWNGGTIKKGIDGVTYVPRSPPARHSHYSSDTALPGHTIVYSRRRIASGDSGGDNWSALYNAALREDAEERAFYERQHSAQSERRSKARSAAEQKWQEKIDKVFREGTLSYVIRKAKADR